MAIFEISSSWTLALGRTLVHSIWVGLIILGVLKLSFLWIPARMAGHRYRLASAALLLYAGVFVALFSLLYEPSQAIGEKLTVAAAIKMTDFPELKIQGRWHRPVWCYCTWLYFIGITISMIRFAVSISFMQSIRRSSRPVRGAWLARFNEFRERAGIGARIRLLVSGRTDTPLLAGILRPVIIVPAGMLTLLPFEQVEAILMHELFHLKRFDHLVNILQRVAEVLFFYNPAVWSISGTIRKERENCCDDLVLGGCSRPLDYARALYQLALEQRGAFLVFPAATGSGSGHLKTRILRMLNPTAMKTNIREKISALLLLIAGVIIVTVITGFSSAFSIIQYKGAPGLDSRTGAVPGPARIVSPDPGQAVMPAHGPAPLPFSLPDPGPAVMPAHGPAPLPFALPDPGPLSQPSVRSDSLPGPEGATTEGMEFEKEEIRKEIEAAMAEIDVKKIREEVAKAMAGIDWEKIRKEVEGAKLEALKELEEIDWEEIRKEVEGAKLEALKELEEIDWEEIRNEMAGVKLQIDSLMQDLDLDFDFDLNVDTVKHHQEDRDGNAGGD
jgi:bla regulator protein BlaR1